MKVYGLALSIIFLIAAFCIYAPAWVLILLGCALNMVNLFIMWRIEQRTDADDKKHNTKLVDAGNAITDTLRVAFEHLKKLASAGQKTQAKLTDHESRLRRIEQYMHRPPGTVADKVAPIVTPQTKENKPSRKRDEPKHEDGNENT
jgi:hypothetical protein